MTRALPEILLFAGLCFGIASVPAQANDLSDLPVEGIQLTATNQQANPPAPPGPRAGYYRKTESVQNGKPVFVREDGQWFIGFGFANGTPQNEWRIAPSASLELFLDSGRFDEYWHRNTGPTLYDWKYGGVIEFIVEPVYRSPCTGLLSTETNVQDLVVAVSGTDKCFFLPGHNGDLALEDWDGAASRCTAEGGRLATISSPAENSAVAALWSYGSIWLRRQHGGGLWIGASDRDEENSFVWTDGSPATFTDWANVYGNLQPNNFRNQDCVAYGYAAPMDSSFDPAPVAGWVDNDCGNKQPFVCQKTCWQSANLALAAEEQKAPTQTADMSSDTSNKETPSIATMTLAAVGIYLLGVLSVLVAMKVLGHARSGRGDPGAAPAAVQAGEGPKTFERTPKAELMWERVRRASARVFSSPKSHATRLEEQAGSAAPV